MSRTHPEHLAPEDSLFVVADFLLRENPDEEEDEEEKDDEEEDDNEDEDEGYSE